MREILFRAKAINRDKGEFRTKYKNGDWVYGLITRPYEDLYELPMQMANTDGICGIEVDYKTVGQFTGLTDKNGKKLFEGDICRVIYIDRRCNSSGEHYEVENLIIEEVVFEKGTFCFKTTIEDISMYRPIGFYIYGKQKIKYFEIIGNVIDNSKLLESE